MEEVLRASVLPVQEEFGKKIAMLKVNMILLCLRGVFSN